MMATHQPETDRSIFGRKSNIKPPSLRTKPCGHLKKHRSDYVQLSDNLCRAKARMRFSMRWRDSCMCARRQYKPIEDGSRGEKQPGSCVTAARRFHLTAM
jgi:hypothetical protein